MKLLSAHMPLFRAVEHDYPVREVIRSVLPIVDEWHLGAPPEDEDGTWALLEDLRDECPEKIHLHAMDWWGAQGRKELSFADATNRLIEKCTGRYHLQLQADEVLHEDDLPVLRELVEAGRADWAQFRRLNFFGTFDAYNATLTRWPMDVARLARRELYPMIRSLGDATELAIPDQDPLPWPKHDLRETVPIYHYCYVKHPRAYVQKQKVMGALYGLGEDPRIVAWRERGKIDWHEMVPAEEYVPLTRSHPAVMTDWIAERREALESGVIA